MEKTDWITCPICRNKTRVKIREDTEFINFPYTVPSASKKV